MGHVQSMHGLLANWDEPLSRCFWPHVFMDVHNNLIWKPLAHLGHHCSKGLLDLLVWTFMRFWQMPWSSLPKITSSWMIPTLQHNCTLIRSHTLYTEIRYLYIYTYVYILLNFTSSWDFVIFREYWISRSRCNIWCSVRAQGWHQKT